MIRSTAVACAVLLLSATSATSATALWRTLQSPDGESGKTVTLARANGLEGRLSLHVTCQQGYYVLALGFDDNVTRHPNREVTERFDLGGAAQALDRLRCGADRRAPE